MMQPELVPQPGQAHLAVMLHQHPHRRHLIHKQVPPGWLFHLAICVKPYSHLHTLIAVWTGVV